ncbi:MAG: oligosaccharide flippase family protein [Caldilineaceae bacterium]|nr:oligosaccharide flippase family protein [Caldilineaceae bacterium]
MAINSLILIGSLAALFSGGNVLVLIGVLVMTQAISAALSLLLLLRSRLLAPPQESVRVSLRELWHRVSPFYALSLADVLQQRIDILLLSVLSGEVVIGLYSAAYNVVRILVKLVQSYWQALYPTFSRLHHQSMQRYYRLCDVSLRYGLMLLLPCAALGAVGAAGLLALIYSDEYIAAAPTFQVLLWSAPLLLVEMYAVTLLMVEHRPKQSLLITGLHLVAVVLIMPPLTASWGAQGAAWSVVLAGAIGMAGSLFLLAQFGLMPKPRPAGVLLVCTLASVLASVWLPVSWMTKMAVSALVYGLLIWRTRAFAPADIELFRKALRATKE